MKKFDNSGPEEVACHIFELYEKAENHEIIRSTTGELSPSVYTKELVENIMKIIEDKNLDVSYLVGPVFQTENGVNYMLDAALGGGPIKIFLSLMRQFTHYIILGNRYAAVQDPHEAVPQKRSGYFLESENPFERMRILQFVHSFDNYIGAYDLRPLIEKSSDVVLLDESQLKRLKQIVQEKRGYYDLLMKDEICQYLGIAA